MTLKNARIYQELLRRLSPSEEADLRPRLVREYARAGRRSDRHAHGGSLSPRTSDRSHQPWNR